MQEEIDRLRMINADMLESLEDRARGYCPSCGCDVCNTAGCDSCTWMRKTRKLLASLKGEQYTEPALLPPDQINLRNAGLLSVVGEYLDALVDNRIHVGGRERVKLAESSLRAEYQAAIQKARGGQ